MIKYPKRLLGCMLIIFTMIFSSSCIEENPFERNKLLLISIDGFRADYIDLYDTPNLDKIVDEGVLADYMIPVFPTKTFPNHYSIATGLFTENSGIIANNMYDSDMNEYYSLGNRESVRNAEWYQGEPIWVTAEKHNLKTAPLFWPGSEAKIGDKYPTYWSEYDHDLPYSARVDSVIHWMEMDFNKSPDFITLYFSKVDTYGHWYGPESDSVSIAVKEIDDHIGYLLDELERIGKRDILNIILVSDHGMSETTNERVIILDEIIDIDDVEVIDWNPVAMIQPVEGKIDEVYNSLKNSERNYRVFRKENIPERLRVKNHKRVPELMVIADVGYSITTQDRANDESLNGGTHGYDNQSDEMRSFFLASGPDFKNGLKINSFQNIHIYELMANLLKIEPAPNDGNLDSLKFVLNEPSNNQF